MNELKTLDEELFRTITNGIPLDRLREICDAERNGRCVVLPCWNRVFIVSGGQVQEMDMCHYRGNSAGVYDMRCECVDQHEECDRICANENEKCCAYNFRVAEIGKTAFLTRSEAEAALQSGGSK